MPSLPRIATMDGNEAVALIAHRLCEVSVIYPITPSSTMGELADQWSAVGRKNLWGSVPRIASMQSEAGAAGAVHGALTAGSLATTFTASQGLLLMLPNMYKIAGELTPFVMHVAARTLATHALSIFGDHADVMACRQTGFVMLASNSVQEAHDMAAIAHAATLKLSLPVLHFFDGFRTSHEVQKIQLINDDVLEQMMDDELIADFRQRALSPDHPTLKGTAQNPDVFFQTREAANRYYDAAPGVIQGVMDQFAGLTGRSYSLYEYEGDPQAQRVIVMMGSGAETAAATAQKLAAQGQRVGVLKARLYRPFDSGALIAALPSTTRAIAVLDRTKEPGATGEPLYLDVLGALTAHRQAGGMRFDHDHEPVVIGGRYGLSSKAFSPGMVQAVFDELTQDRPRQSFTVGILDDVTHLSLTWDPDFYLEDDRTFGAVFYGLGADGTVGANKNTVKIIGQTTDHRCQGYFVYDSKKSGATTTSHLRFGPDPIRSPYLINRADFVGCHQFVFLDRFDPLALAQPGAIFLLNAPYPPGQVWDRLPGDLQQTIIDKKIRLHAIDAMTVARKAGMGSRINTIMQTCFFALSDVIPADQAIDHIKTTIEKTYGKKGPEIVRRNFDAVDAAVTHLHRIPVPARATSTIGRRPVVSDQAPDFVQRITARIIAGEGDRLPVSACPADGTWPTDTARWEKRGIAEQIPIWDPDVCIQCNKCALVCPHAAIRAKAYDPDAPGASDGPDTFQSVDYKAKDLRGSRYTLQVAPDDCTGCQLCVMVCPAKNKATPRLKAINMRPYAQHADDERANYDYFLGLPETPRKKIVRLDAKGSQFFRPLMESSGACAGCGETPYLKLITQLFGDRMMIANATGCSSIYGGNLPTTPYARDASGRGPAWSNSLFEDNAEFGYGMRLALDTQTRQALDLLAALGDQVNPDLAAELIAGVGLGGVHGQIDAQRRRIETLRQTLHTLGTPPARRLLALADQFAAKSVWIIGGDGWAYDIGYGGLDHVLAQKDNNINILVLDTEVYSNTGGQASKSTPLGAAAKFAAAGKGVAKKDLGLMAMSYGHVYVASVAFGAKDNQTVTALLEAESYPGPSLVIAYSHCIAHGYDLKHGLTQQKLAVDSGVWPLYRFDPRRIGQHQPPLQLDSGPIKAKVRDYHANETRFRMVQKMNPDRYARLERQAQRDSASRIKLYKQLAQVRFEAAAPPRN